MSGLKRLISCALLIFIVAGSSRNAEAAASRIIVKLNTGSPIGPVLNSLNASVLDVISDSNLYLLQVPLVPSIGTLTLNLLGIAYIEVDTTLSAPTLRTLGVLQSQSAAADWYRLQPALTRIRAVQASKSYDG